MSDLSWLNPTPHAIAVYASQPLSPVATQHSLPSGRYSLLGPVFHRLDRTSFAWRTHSITSSARASSEGGTETPSVLAVLRFMTSSNLVGCTTVARRQFFQQLDALLGELGDERGKFGDVAARPRQALHHAGFDRLADRRHQRPATFLAASAGGGQRRRPRGAHRRLDCSLVRDCSNCR